MNPGRQVSDTTLLPWALAPPSGTKFNFRGADRLWGEGVNSEAGERTVAFLGRSPALLCNSEGRLPPESFGDITRTLRGTGSRAMPGRIPAPAVLTPGLALTPSSCPRAPAGLGIPLPFP